MNGVAERPTINELMSRVRENRSAQAGDSSSAEKVAEKVDLPTPVLEESTSAELTDQEIKDLRFNFEEDLNHYHALVDSMDRIRNDISSLPEVIRTKYAEMMLPILDESLHTPGNFTQAMKRRFQEAAIDAGAKQEELQGIIDDIEKKRSQLEDMQKDLDKLGGQIDDELVKILGTLQSKDEVRALFSTIEMNVKNESLREQLLNQKVRQAVKENLRRIKGDTETKMAGIDEVRTINVKKTEFAPEDPANLVGSVILPESGGEVKADDFDPVHPQESNKAYADSKDDPNLIPGIKIDPTAGATSTVEINQGPKDNFANMNMDLNPLLEPEPAQPAAPAKDNSEVASISTGKGDQLGGGLRELTFSTNAGNAPQGAEATNFAQPKTTRMEPTTNPTPASEVVSDVQPVGMASVTPDGQIVSEQGSLIDAKIGANSEGGARIDKIKEGLKNPEPPIVPEAIASGEKSTNIIPPQNTPTPETTLPQQQAPAPADGVLAPAASVQGTSPQVEKGGFFKKIKDSLFGKSPISGEAHSGNVSKFESDWKKSTNQVEQKE